MGYRKIPDRYTPFFDVMSDLEGRDQHRRNESDYFDGNQNIFGSKSDFKAKVISTNSVVQDGNASAAPSGKYTKCYVRVEGLTDNVILEPCDLSVGLETDEQKAKMFAFIVGGCHPVAYSSHQVEPGESPKTYSIDDVLSLEFDEGPSYLGRQRGPKYKQHKLSSAPGYTDGGCAAIQAMTTGQGATQRIGAAVGAGSSVIPASVVETWQGQVYEPNIQNLSYTPRANSSSPYDPRGPAKVFSSDKRGPDYNGPDGSPEYPWQIANAAYPTHPIRTRITCRFGKPRSSGPHGGVDIGHGGGGPGEPMYAILDGKVSGLNAFSPSAGGLIEIKHKGALRKDGKKVNLKSRYLHCEAIYVSRNEIVKKGQHIADMGNTGNSRGCHLHLDLRWEYKKSVNPNIALGFKYSYTSKAKKDVEKHGERLLYDLSYKIEGME